MSLTDVLLSGVGHDVAVGSAVAAGAVPDAESAEQSLLLTCQ